MDEHAFFPYKITRRLEAQERLLQKVMITAAH